MVEELFRLTQAETGILSQDAYPDMSATYPKFTELYRYQVPVDRRLIFRPGHTFSVYAKYLNENVDSCGYDDANDVLYETMATIEAETSNALLSAAAPADTDYTFFGYRYKWKELYITLVANADLDDADADTQWDYWNGSSWSDLPGLTDGTDGFSTGAGAVTVSWTLPGNWAAYKIGGAKLYLIRRVIATYAATGGAMTASDIEVHQDEAVDNKDQFKIEVRDQNELVRKPVVQPSQYRTLSEFTDRDTVKRLDIAEAVVAGPGDWVVISAKAISPVDVSECYFELTCDREMIHLF